ncbi:MAG: TadE/TadG family type IV pilus assembly protein [Pseudomonadota bacterium]
MTRVKPSTSLKEFRKREDGTATVEFVLWVPIFILILGFVVDVTSVMLQQSRYYDIARDASRQVALGLKTPSEARTDVETVLGAGISVSVSQDAQFATTTISAPLRELVTFFNAVPLSGSIESSVSMFRESAASP